MAEREHDSLDDAGVDDEALPVSPDRRRTAITTGCFFVLLILAGLIYFVATHTETTGDRGFLGMKRPAGELAPLHAGTLAGHLARRLVVAHAEQHRLA